MNKFALYLVLSSCSRPLDPKLAGSRLALTTSHLAGAAETFQDTALGLECQYVRVGYDSYRCLPTHLPTTQSCEGQRMIKFPIECGPVEPPAFIQSDADVDLEGCRHPNIYKLGAPTVACGGGYLVGEPVDLSEFAHAKAEAAALGERFEMVKLTGDDGSVTHLFEHLYDKTLDLFCRQTLVGDEFVCRPEATTSFTYADEACSTQVFPVRMTEPRKACELPSMSRAKNPRRIFQTTDTAACESDDRTYEDGSVVTLATRYSQVSGMCQEVKFPLPQGEQLHAVGAEISRDAMAHIRIVKQGTGRIQSVLLRYSDGTEMRSSEFRYDTQLETLCRPALFDGEARCVPVNTAFVAPAFLDSECKSAVAEDSSTCYTRRFAVSFDKCNAQLWRATTTRAGEASTPLYLRTDNGCVSTSPAKQPSYALDALPSSDLATLDAL